jgi:hypothetical protein
MTSRRPYRFAKATQHRPEPVLRSSLKGAKQYSRLRRLIGPTRAGLGYGDGMRTCQEHCRREVVFGTGRGRPPLRAAGAAAFSFQRKDAKTRRGRGGWEEVPDSCPQRSCIRIEPWEPPEARRLGSGTAPLRLRVFASLRLCVFASLRSKNDWPSAAGDTTQGVPGAIIVNGVLETKGEKGSPSAGGPRS